FAKDFYRTGSRFHRTNHMPEQRAFATTASAHNNERLATVDVEGDIVEHGAIPKLVDKIDNLDDWRFVGVHAAKKKIPVSTAFVTNIASKACTTEAVVAWPTPSAPPSTCSPALQAIVITIHAKTTLLIIPEYKSHGSALSSARST